MRVALRARQRGVMGQVDEGAPAGVNIATQH
jgi:hypothetical protein